MQERASNIKYENEANTDDSYQFITNSIGTPGIERISGIERSTTIFSMVATYVPLITIIPLILLVRKYRKKQLNSKTEEEKMKNKRKKRICIIIIIMMIILFGLGSLAGMVYSFKPIIYLYPEETTELSVTLGKAQNITCSYPKYDSDGWQVIAHPNGDLEDKDTGRKLYALYWEGINDNKAKLKEGFVVKKENTISFLEEKLAILGLNERESEEFIVYWLPKLQENEYNLIRFETKEEIDENMPLYFSKQPDTVIRVLMQYKGLKRYKEIPEQTLEKPERKGFVAVEWGGTEIK